MINKKELEILEKLIEFRAKLWDFKVIGQIGEVSFGNVSHRMSETTFAISQSNTGSERELSTDEFFIIEIVNEDFSSLNVIRGSITATQKPSRDTTIHSALYSASQEINVVVHFHNPFIWKDFYGVFPTTSGDSPECSIELAKEVYNICKSIDFENNWIIILGSHKDGILTFGNNLETLEQKIISLLEKYPR